MSTLTDLAGAWTILLFVLMAALGVSIIGLEPEPEQYETPKD